MKSGPRYVVFAGVLAGACSGTADAGFISIGRDEPRDESISGSGGISGSAGAPATSGTVGGTGGTVETGGTTSIPGGTTGVNGGTTGVNGGTTGVNGGTTGVNGGTSTGACSGEGMPALPNSSVGGGAILDACERAGENERICMGDAVWYCGQNVGGLVEQCAFGTCATGCCHAAGDPCPRDFPPTNEFGELIDCAGDCGAAVGACLHFGVPTLPLRLLENNLLLVRVGSGSAEIVCGETNTSWFFDLELTGPAARVTVSPPWKLSASYATGTSACPNPSQSDCIVSEEGEGRLVTVSTDVDAPVPRNVVIETSEIELTCP